MAHILIVDADASIRASLTKPLCAAGHVVAEAPDDLAALPVLYASSQSLLVVLGNYLARLDGAVILQAVADDPQLRRHAFVVSTSITTDRYSPELRSLVEQYAMAVLWKPVRPTDLLRVLALRSSRRREGGVSTQLPPRCAVEYGLRGTQAHYLDALDCGSSIS